MTFHVQLDPSLVWLFAQAVSDVAPQIREQLNAPDGAELVVPLTMLRAVSQHFDTEGELRLWPTGEPTPEGGASGQFHAEQHFEYFSPVRVGMRIIASTYAGSTWSKTGRSGTLEFGETFTDYHDENGTLLVRSRKVGVRVGGDSSDG